jgi:hypothetical protein
MAIFPEVGWMVQNAPELSEQAQRALDLKGQLPLQQVDPHLALDIQVDDWTRPEYAFLRRRILYQQVSGAANVAAQFSQVGLLVPATRVLLAHVYRITIVSSGATFTAQVGVTAQGVGGMVGAVSGFSADDRALAIAGGGRSGCALTAGNAAALIQGTGLTGLRFVQVPANGSVTIDTNFTLTSRQPPGSTNFPIVVVEATTVNIGMQVSFEWWERALLTSEF